MLKHTNSEPVDRQFSWHNFPWWLAGVIIVLLILIYLVASDPELNEAFLFILRGLPTTVGISLLSFFLAVGAGSLVILGIRSRSVILRNISLFYMATIGSIPLLFLILVIAFLLIPAIAAKLNMNNTEITVQSRFVLALGMAYTVFWVEQYFVELGNYTNFDNEVNQKKRRLDLFWSVPLKRIALLAGLTFVGILKDSAWMSILAIQDIAQLSKLYAGSTFQFYEAYLAAVLLYLLLTVPFNSVLVHYYQKLGERSQFDRNLSANE